MNKEFYPTPVHLLDKILYGVRWELINDVLEPSAGKGNIALYVKEKLKRNYHKMASVDCIEKDPELQTWLKGKDLTLISDDFLTFTTYKQYDLIIMNPPFSDGDKHLLKALEMQKNGGNIICILNAETLRNTYTNTRKELLKKLTDLHANIEFMEDEFVQAERPTKVEIAVIKVNIPKKKNDSIFLNELKQEQQVENTNNYESASLVSNDYIEAIIAQYNLEVSAGIKLIQEYEAMKPYIMDSIVKKSFSKPTIELSINGNFDSSNVINNYIYNVRYKYWHALFNNNKFTNGMTSNLKEKYRSEIINLSQYDFSFFNIKTIQEDIAKSLVAGIEECIIKLFDELSFQYSYSDELSNNIHYYNGWKTNKAWIINKKIIYPFLNAWNYLNKYDPTNYNIIEKLSDIEKSLAFLDCGKSEHVDLYNQLEMAKKNNVTKKIKLKYFTISFYKKGTCHIEFTNLELLKKLNIFGSQQKGWLPPAYGKKEYDDLSLEEKKIIDDFEGEQSYRETIKNREYFSIMPTENLCSNLLD